MSEFIYYFVVAFIGSAILIFLAKVIMDKLMRKPVDYYEKDELTEEQHMLETAGLKKSRYDRKKNRKEGK